MLLVLITLFAAHAQAPGALPPGFDLSSLGLAPATESRWATEATTAVRFADGSGDGPTLAVGDRVDVIMVDGDKVRIRSGEKYGWVPASALSLDPPAPAATDGAPQLNAPAQPSLLSQPLLAPAPPAPAPAPQ